MKQRTAGTDIVRKSPRRWRLGLLEELCTQSNQSQYGDQEELAQGLAAEKASTSTAPSLPTWKPGTAPHLLGAHVEARRRDIAHVLNVQHLERYATSRFNNKMRAEVLWCVEGRHVNKSRHRWMLTVFDAIR